MPPEEEYRITVGFDDKERELAILTKGGHPSIPGSGECFVCGIAIVDELPDRDIDAWFKEQMETKPWETRQ